jgi:hypothetical protein
MPAKSKTNRKTRNNRKTRKMKGGYWCIFEKNFGSYSKNCQPGIIEFSKNYYYFSNHDVVNNEYTLFCYRPHVFKHFDDLYSSIIPTIDIVNPKTVDITYPNGGYYYMPYSFFNPPGNLKVFKDALESFIVNNRITYTKLLDTIVSEATKNEDYNISIILDSTNNNSRQVEIYWQKKKKPIILPRILSENNINQRDYDEKYKFCIQIVSLVAIPSQNYTIKRDTKDINGRKPNINSRKTNSKNPNTNSRKMTKQNSADEKNDVPIPVNYQHSLDQFARRDSMIRRRRRHIQDLYNELPESDALDYKS